ncbi:MAG: trehalose synthase [Chloroflexi bacterium]|nr:trehalose synthase [Chloroflexota bacterium]
MRHRELWYKDAIIYSLDVETFQDSNGDGVGDFEGLIRRLDYLAALNVTCIWLLPFFPSPNRDNGYDVTDYYGVDPRLGSLGDFVEFVHQAHNNGMRVMIDLVVNHTSIDHPWFQAAREGPSSPFYDYYVWSKEKPEDAHEDVVFPGVQESIWTYDRKAKAYYLHHFYDHQPDLNIANQAVRDEIRKIMAFWLKLGVSGFRVDAAPFLIGLRGLDEIVPDNTDPYVYLREFRDFLSWRRGDAIMLAEANVTMDKIPEYFGDGDRLHMLFNFMVNQHLFLALACEEAGPLIEGLRLPPEIPTSGQWANFLRNHDELDLGRLSDEQRAFVFEQFAPQKNMQLYDRGLRRRLAPMLGNDRRRLELANSLLLTLPGTPVLRYGQEIGMGENLELNERDSVRTPMQWSDDPNAGFSIADRSDLFRPVIDEGEYGYQQVNVMKQRRDPDSLLNWTHKALLVRRQCPEFGYGDWYLLEADHPAVLVHRCEWGGGVVVAVHNLSSEKVSTRLDLSDYSDDERWLGLFSDHAYDELDGSGAAIELAGYGYRWFRIEKPAG